MDTGLNVVTIILYYGISLIILKPHTRGLRSLKAAGVVLLVSTILTDHLLLGLLVLLAQRMVISKKDRSIYNVDHIQPLISLLNNNNSRKESSLTVKSFSNSPLHQLLSVTFRWQKGAWLS